MDLVSIKFQVRHWPDIQNYGASTMFERVKPTEQRSTLHRKYGKVVRTAPNVIDVSDPTMIPVIYNLK
jgi:hypothetical protein